MQERLSIKNKRLKMSPGGLITLPVSARRTLGMKPGQGCQVSVQVNRSTIVITPEAKGQPAFRVSQRGMMSLAGDAERLLNKADKRHYWLELNDQKQTVALHPFMA